MPGLLTRIARAIRNQAPAEQSAERRDAGGFSVGMGVGFAGFSAPGGTFMSAVMAENVSTIMASVQLISATIGTLPPFVYRREGAGRTEAPNHPVARLVQAPNERQTWPDFAEWLTAQMLLYGNGLALIESDGNGQPRRLVPIPWSHCIPILTDTGRLAFDVLQLGPWGGTGLPRRVLDTEVLHVRDRSDDAYLGRSRLARAPEVIRSALGLQEYSSSIWDNAASPSGFVRHPGKLSSDAKQYLSDSFRRRHQGAHNARSVPILDEGMSFDATGKSPEDAEVLQSRRFSAEDCARVMGVPPPLVGIWDHSSFTNSATASAWMGTFTILPIVRKIEAEFARTVFADPGSRFHLELDMTALMRGDATAQQAANVAAVQAGIMTIDEARRDLGLNPLGPAAGLPIDGALPGVEP